MIKNKTSTVNYKSEMVFNNFVNFEEDKVLLKDYTPKEVAMFFYLIEPPKIKIVYEMSDPVCECGNKLHKHNIIEWNMDKKYPIYKYQYKCPKCNKTIITPLEGIVDKGCCYTTDIKDMTVNLYSKEHISYANSNNFINEQYDLNISRQSIYNFNDKYSDSYLTEKEELIEEKLKEKNIEPTGFPGHDETFLNINGEKYALLTMLDSNNQKIINNQLMVYQEDHMYLTQKLLVKFLKMENQKK